MVRRWGVRRGCGGCGSGADILSVEAVIRFVFSLEPRAPTERTASRSNARRFESAVSNRASRRRPLVTPSRLASDDASAVPASLSAMKSMPPINAGFRALSAYAPPTLAPSSFGDGEVERFLL